MSYRIAGIDVHKKMLAVVVSDVEIDSEYQFERRRFSSNPEQLRSLTAWLLEQEAEEVVMESTAQYLETSVGSAGKVLETAMRDARRRKAEVWTLHLAQALSNCGRPIGSNHRILNQAKHKRSDFRRMILRRWVTGTSL
jgi:hypothetical protein